MKVKSYTIQSVSNGANSTSILQHPVLILLFAIYVSILIGIIAYSILSYFDLKRQYLGIARRKFPVLIRPEKSKVPSVFQRWKIHYKQNRYFKSTEEGLLCSDALMAATVSVLVCAGALAMAFLELNL